MMQHLKFVHAMCGCDTVSASCVKDKTVDVRLNVLCEFYSMVNRTL